MTFAIAVLASPLLLVPGTILNPAMGGVGRGTAAIAANAAADPTTNGLHVAAFVALAFLLPFSALGLAELAYDGSPWLATIGGGLALLGWIPWGPLTAQDDLTFQMAQMGGGAGFASLLDRFTGDAVMMVFLVVYIVAHLAAYVILGIALARAHAVPAWAAGALALTSPLTLVAFPTHQQGLLLVVIGLLIAGSVPSAVALLTARPSTGGRS